jgi:uncharacterized membrane protein YdjX (TVP38/TMEM64 family)
VAILVLFPAPCLLCYKVGEGGSLPKFVKPVAALLLLVGVVLLLRGLNIAQYLTPAALKQLMFQTAPYEHVVFVGLCIACIFLHIPVIFLVALGGAFFGVVEGFLYGWLGCVLGSMGTFLLVRYAAKDAFQQKVSTRFPWLTALDQKFAASGFQTILLLRLFLFMAPPLNWIIGVSHLQLRHYISGTMLGIGPILGISNYFGSLIEQAQSLSVLLEPRVLIPGVLLILAVAAGGFFGSRYIAKTKETA